MIDSHCHLEQKDFDIDRNEVIENCKRAGLKAVVTSCAHPKDFDLTMDICRKYRNFVFPSIGFHPELAKEFTGKHAGEYMEKIKLRKKEIVAIGEIGLDFHWVKEEAFRKKQGEQFAEFIRFSKELKKPIVVHCRDESGNKSAYTRLLDILEKESAKEVLLHMFGAHEFLGRVLQNNFFISINTIVLQSKSYRKIAMDLPLENMMLETDSPWLGFGKRNDPTAIRQVAEKIAEIKKMPFEEVWKKCGENSARFFGLKQ